MPSQKTLFFGKKKLNFRCEIIRFKKRRKNALKKITEAKSRAGIGDYLADSQINSRGKERGTLALQLQAKKK